MTKIPSLLPYHLKFLKIEYVAQTIKKICFHFRLLEQFQPYKTEDATGDAMPDCRSMNFSDILHRF